mgnify:CR=1 FL=1
MACRSSRLEYDERVCLASASDEVLQSVEYRLRVGRGLAERQALLFLGRKTSHELVTINNALLLKYTGDSEVLQKSTRPYVLVVRLKYKDACYDFAVPIRSNIPASAPKDQYFALPPRPQTRPKNRHGLHYIKMFPVTKQYLVRYRTEGNSFATLIHDIIEKNSKQIVDECQHYLCIYLYICLYNSCNLFRYFYDRSVISSNMFYIS